MPPPHDDDVFKALADPTRRALLDTLRERHGMTLGDLCEGVAMSRQAVTQHLDLLVMAGLVVVERRGRQRWHYLNAVPIHQIAQRWLRRFDDVHLRALDTITRTAQEHPMTDTGPLPDYTYVTYIDARPQQVWDALTDPEVTAIYWHGMANRSDWRPGSTWRHERTAEAGAFDIWGQVLEADPPRLLRFTFQPASQPLDQQGSVVTYRIEPQGEAVRLTVTQTGLPDRGMLEGISQGWPAVLSSLKSYLEHGAPLSEETWAEVHA